MADVEAKIRHCRSRGEMSELLLVQKCGVEARLKFVGKISLKFQLSLFWTSDRVTLICDCLCFCFCGCSPIPSPLAFAEDTDPSVDVVPVETIPGYNLDEEDEDEGGGGDDTGYVVSLVGGEMGAAETLGSLEISSAAITTAEGEDIDSGSAEWLRGQRPSDMARKRGAQRPCTGYKSNPG